jgi:hypothetical protein
MSVAIQVNMYNPAGVFLDAVEGWDNLSAARKINSIGDFSIDMPYKFWKYMERDTRFEILRSIDGGPNIIFGGTHFFSRKFVRRSIGTPFTVSGPDANDLMKRVIVAFPANSSQADITNVPADDAIKGLADNNLVYNGAATPPRGFKVISRQPLYSQAPNISKGFSRREVFAVALEMAQQALASGIYLTFDIQIAGGFFELRTYVNCRGVDRRESYNANPLILSEETGTMTNVERTDDYTGEATVIYAGGTGNDAARLIGKAYDLDRINAGPFNTIEKWVEANNISVQAELDAEAARELIACRPKHSLNGDMIDGPGNQLDVNYGLGDFATARYDKDSFPVELNSIALSFDKTNGQTITTRLDGSLWTSS